MVKTLQRKFMFASMLAVTILLVTLVGTINIIYCFSVNTREKSLLEMLCETDGRPEGRPAGPEMNERTDKKRDDLRDTRLDREFNGGFLHRRMSMDEVLSARFFAVWFDGDGQIIFTDTSRIYAVSEDGASEMARAIDSLGKNTGVYQGFRYMIAEKECFLPADAETGTSQSGETGVSADRILLAMDISSDRGDMLRILGISFLIAALCWAAMLVPVHALAKRAIAPTAMSIERQKQFVTNAGHELKTPLAIIQANTDALELYKGESKWTRNIRAQTIRLNGLMQNLLTLSRMDENSLTLEKKSFALDLLIGEVWEDFAEPAAGRKLSVQFGKEEEVNLNVLANRESIAQLLSILFDNAVKYTPRGGRIEVQISAGSDLVSLIQSNTITEEEEEKLRAGDPERLFERFYRTDSDRSRKKGGSGIGLSAARAIVGANNGTIRADIDCGRIVFSVSLKRTA